MTDINNQQKTINQHYIPRFLIRGFATCINPEAKKKRRNYNCYIGTATKEYEWIDINNVACEKYYFESKEIELNRIEKILAKNESRHASTLLKIQSEGRIHKSQFHVLAELFFQLSIRIKNLRIVISELYDRAIEEAVIETANLSELKKKFYPEFRKSFQQKNKRYPTAKELQFYLPHIRDGLEKIINDINSAATNFDTELTVKNSLNNSLNKIIDDSQKISETKYHSYDWLIHNTSESLILGDICALAYISNKNKYEPSLYVYNNDDIDHVLLPISNNQLIVGFDSTKFPKPHVPSINIINHSTVELSQEFVVSSNTQVLDDSLLNQLGKRTELSKERLNELK